MNKAIIIGNLTKRPVKAMTQDNIECSKFTLAVGEKPEYIDCTAWRKIANVCNTYLDKGKKVMVEGEIRTNKWQDQRGEYHYSTYIYVLNMEMLSPKNQEMSAPSQTHTEELGLPPLEKEEKEEDYKYGSWNEEDMPF